MHATPTAPLRHYTDETLIAHLTLCVYVTVKFCVAEIGCDERKNQGFSGKVESEGNCEEILKGRKKELKIFNDNQKERRKERNEVGN